MTASNALTADLRRLVLRLEDDLRARVESDAAVKDVWTAEHRQALQRGRTASSWTAWRDDQLTQAAVGWVLATVFVRFCEDNRLIAPVWIAGPEHRRQEALDAQLAFFRQHPEDTDREWFQEAIAYLASLPATAALVDEYSALHLVSPSGDAATELLAFWRMRGDDGQLVHDLTDPTLSTRFLGDLYQDLSEHAKATFALLQTPVFVEEFILDRTLTPALSDRPLEGFRLIDPTCGSGHFLLGAFARLLDRWHRHAPGLELQARVQEALDAIHGVDLNPFAVAIARFRLTVAALQSSGLRSLESAPAFRFHLAVGDSLLHGPGQQTLSEDVDLSGFAYATEDLALLQQTLAGGRYDVVVGNPPYITVKDKQLNAAYRQRYATCSGKYALTVPFMERFFDLARPARGDRPAGWVGQITSNSFMKREFGSKLIEQFLVAKDLVFVIDSEGAWIAGHNSDGTPTVIIIGRNQSPQSSTVRAVLSKGKREVRPVGEEGRGPYWQSIVTHLDTPGWDDGWLTVTDLGRASLETHPWSLSGGGAVELLAALEAASSTPMAEFVESIGIVAFTLEDDVYVADAQVFAMHGIGPSDLREMVLGEGLRDWRSSDQPSVLFPYDKSFAPIQIEAHPHVYRWMWPYRTNLANGILFGGQTKLQAGLLWTEFGRLTSSKLHTALSITFAFVASHNHFVLDHGGAVFNRSAPVVKLRENAAEREHQALLGLLNSSVACFWLRSQSQPKGGAAERLWSRTYEFTGTTLQSYPLPARLPAAKGTVMETLSRQLSQLTPHAVCARQSPTATSLDVAREAYNQALARMMAVQEELDWEVYRLYGLVDEDLEYAGEDLPGLALGERTFEIALARSVLSGEEETAWFSRHGSRPITEVPQRWPAAYQALIQRRLDTIARDPLIRLLEKPENKRRWASKSWDEQQIDALRTWLLGELGARRFWFDSQGRSAPRSVGQLADDVSRDHDLVGVLALWEGRPNVPVSQSLTRLLADEAVPYLAAYRYKEAGLRKRVEWEATWALQRLEDEGRKVGPITVPPKYTPADFRKTSYWQARGKVDVPKERFILYPDAGRDTDPTPLIGWAGWDHAQQSLALSLVIGMREAEGWSDERLVPLVAGLAELQPWVNQWHPDVDPTYGVSLAAFCREQLTARAAQVGRSLKELAAWRPVAATTGRRSRTAT